MWLEIGLDNVGISFKHWTSGVNSASSDFNFYSPPPNLLENSRSTAGPVFPCLYKAALMNSFALQQWITVFLKGEHLIGIWDLSQHLVLEFRLSEWICRRLRLTGRSSWWPRWQRKPISREGGRETEKGTQQTHREKQRKESPFQALGIHETPLSLYNGFSFLLFY